MVGLAAAERLVLGTAGGLVADEVGPGAAYAGGAYRLVGVDHDPVLGRFLQGVLVVVVDPLAVVVLTARDDVAHVTALDRGVVVAVHQLVGLVEVPLIVAAGGGGLVVH